MSSARRMSALDAAFFNLERRGQLLHVGGVYTVEGRLDFEQQLADLAARLHLIPRYVQRVVRVPFGLAHPTWEPDPHFNLRRHVLHHVLRPPGDDAQLVKLAGRLFAQPLDRRRPLWELHQIDGYRGDRSALVAKVHHCMIDGVSGVQLLGVIFDVTPKPAPPPPPPPAADVPPLPSALVQLMVAARDALEVGSERARQLVALVRQPARMLDELALARDAVAELLQLLLTPPPRTPFNGHVSILRRVVWATVPLAEVKAIRNRLGGTVNDVVLAAISSALRAYLERHGFLADRVELRAMLPVNIRTPAEHLRLGNRISMLVAPLPVGIYDPLERLRQVAAATAQLKGRGQAAHLSRALELLELLPPVIQRPLGWLQVWAAPINTICTNVPGPAVSLYSQGKRIETLVPIVPLAQGVGLAFAILSYADTLTVCLTTDPALVPDDEGLRDLVREGLEELRSLAGVERSGRRIGATRPERQRRRDAAAGRPGGRVVPVS